MSMIARRPGSPAVFTIRNRKSACGLLTWQKEEIDREFFFAPALHRLRPFGNGHLAASTNAYRIVNGEGDFFPGLIVDRYADFLVCQFFTAGMALFKDDIVEASGQLSNPATAIFERSEGRVGDEEGLEPCHRRTARRRAAGGNYCRGKWL